MATVDDWSDLITVNYKGGYGGEFFSFLLYESYHGNLEYIHHDNKYRYDFTPLDPLSQTPLFWFSRLDHTDKIISLPIHCDQNITKKLIKIKNVCYSEDREEYLFNLRNFFLTHYFPKHKQNNITKLHNIITDENSLFIHEVFPKSKNYDLICKNESEHFFFKTLFFYKVLARHFTYYDSNNIAFNRHGIDEIFTMDQIFDNGFPFFKSKEKGIKIDVFDLFINKKNELNLNEKKISKYRDDIFYILDKFNIDLSHTYTQAEMYEVIERYLKNKENK